MIVKLKTTLLLCLVLCAFAVRAQEKSPVDPDEISDVLERAKAKGKLVACADPYAFPYSAQNTDPPGFDIEIIRNIAKRAGLRTEIYWQDTGTRGGTARAFRNSIFKKRCDVFLGLSDNGDDDLLMGKLTFTDPYIGLGYVLVVQGKADSMKTLDELKGAGVKVGVPMSTPIDDYLFMREISRGLYADNRRIMQGMANGEVDAGFVWATNVSLAKAEFPTATFHMVAGYIPQPDHRWNSKFAVRKEDQSMLQFINDGIKGLLSDGTMQKIIESYGVPFYAPFP